MNVNSVGDSSPKRGGPAMLGIIHDAPSMLALSTDLRNNTVKSGFNTGTLPVG